MKYLITFILIFIMGCSKKTEYSYTYIYEVPDSLKENLRHDFISVTDVETLSLSGDPDYDDDIAEIFYRLKDTYEVKVHGLQITEKGNIRRIYGDEIGNKLKPIADSVKQKYYGD